MKIQRTVIACLAALAVAGCSPADTGTTRARPTPEQEQVGEPAVFARIKALTDCAEIQAEFETAFGNSEKAEPGTARHEAAVAYMDAANDRLEAVGC